MEGHVTKENHHIGMEVVRGKNWDHGNQDGGSGNIGNIIGSPYLSNHDYWVKVRWQQNKATNVYRVGPVTFDLKMTNSIYELW